MCFDTRLESKEMDSKCVHHPSSLYCVGGTSVERALMKTNDSLASTKSLLMFNENNHDPWPFPNTQGLQQLNPKGLKAG